jgi:hypothetical protein
VQLVALDGHAIDQLSKGGVLYWIQSQHTGAHVAITVQRGGERHVFSVVIGHSLAATN